MCRLMLPLLLFVTPCAAPGLPFLSNTLGNDMVLQRAPAVAVVFGVSNVSNATVTTLIRRAGGHALRLTTTAGADGTWRQHLPPTPTSTSLAGINFTFTSSAGQVAYLTGVLFGDVYLAGGVSRLTLSPHCSDVSGDALGGLQCLCELTLC
jgi:hypothetical protein